MGAAVASLDSVVFVGGCMRSGTTLAQRILCSGKGAHPLPAECQYLTSLLAAYRSGADRFDLFGRDYFGSLEAYDAFNRRILGEFLAETHRTLGAPRHLVLKNPEITFHFADLAKLLPQVRFLLVIRDPRDTVASMLDVADRHAERGVASPLAALGRDMKKLSGLFLRYYANPYAHPDRFANRLMTMRYEDLIASPEPTLARLSQFTGIALEPRALAAPDPESVSAGLKKVETDPAFSGAFWSKKWMKDLSGDSVGRFREKLSAAEIATIEAECASFGRSFRYW